MAFGGSALILLLAALDLSPFAHLPKLPGSGVASGALWTPLAALGIRTRRGVPAGRG
ncbi:hypothetical protein AB0F11_02465 [Streptomyces sp. NPDC032472]|uniref:hypothetical protein n=1 Tax=Streptomyces sp. NPDC032472 TaxID=3155018 RepID=UPI0033E4C76D